MKDVFSEISIRQESSIALVLDDHNIFTTSFCTLLEQTRLFQHVYGFANEDDLRFFLLEKRGKSKVFLFLDYYLKDKICISFINEVRRFHVNMHIIVLSSLTNPILIQNLLNYKIDGFLSKYSESTEIVICVQSVLKSQNLYISPFIQEILSSFKHLNAVPFSAREIEILKLFAQGLTVNATAENLILSRHTIVSHRRRMMAKTNSKTISELLAFAGKIELI
ncbi:MAG TPA: response regulator transcription factor [Chitinophagales bacterium]|nr:response regulator transcription factor [Chitinophagales bacterium]